MQRYGLTIHDNGYEIVPIRPGSKAPSIKDWRKTPSTRASIEGWQKNGRANHGVGIRAATAPMVDIDVRDGTFVKSFIEWIEYNIGFGLVRIGANPKAGVIFRAPPGETFKKVTSDEFVDDKGRKAQLEIQGDGQQYVVFHIHPDTGKPYFYVGKDTPLNTKREDLFEITQAQALAAKAEFERRCEEHGWQRKARKNASLVPASDIDDLDPSIEPTDLTDERLREMVEAIPNDDVSYDQWYEMVMAIHHQTAGSQVGYDIAAQWSEKSSKHNSDPSDADKFDKTWNSLHENPEGRRPITARYIIKIYRELMVEQNDVIVADLIDRLGKADSLKLFRAITAEATKHDLDPALKTQIVDAVQKAHHRITGVKLDVKVARNMVRYDRTSGGTPKWLEDWVYLSKLNRFFNTKNQSMLIREAFDSAFTRHVFTGERAADYALNQVKIPVFELALYLPTAGETFVYDGHSAINTFSPKSFPAIPAELTRTDLRNVEYVEGHFYHLIPEEREAQLFMSWLAYIVQTNGRPNWAIVLQGTEGDGKTWFLHLMAAALGGRNVSTVSPKVLEGSFNDYAQGHILTMIDEVRMHGHNRFDTMNSMKALITNTPIEIHAKYMPAYNAPNTVAYLITSNYQNAMPLTEFDSRYFVLMSQWQTKADIDRFKKENPEYYKRIWNAIGESPGAIRQWFLEMKLHPEFDPAARAPFSHGRERMIASSKPEESEILRELLAEKTDPLISANILVVSKLLEHLYEDGHMVAGHTVRTVLEGEGFSRIGRIRIDGKYENIWTQNPRMFSNGRLDPNDHVRKLIRNAKKSIT